jgi:hypothetical protein
LRRWIAVSVPRFLVERLWRILSLRHKGQENAVSGPVLKEEFALKSTRDLQALVEVARNEYGLPICSCPQGYYRATSYADGERCLRWLGDMEAKHRRDRLAVQKGLDKQFGSQMSFLEVAK